MKKIILALYLLAVSACSVNGSSGDRILIDATPKGMQAFADMTNGLIRTGKESPEQSSEFFAHRNTQEKQETDRHNNAIGFWQKLVN